MGAGGPAGDRQGAGLGTLQVAWPSMRRGGGSQAGPLTGEARECIPEIPRSRGERTVGLHPSETDQPALPVIRRQRPRVRGCRLTGLATQTYWTAGSRALGPSQGAEGSSLRCKPGSGALALFWASLFPLSLWVSSTPRFRRCSGPSLPFSNAYVLWLGVQAAFLDLRQWGGACRPHSLGVGGAVETVMTEQFLLALRILTQFF